MNLSKLSTIPRPLAILWCVAHYYTLMRSQVTDLVFPDDKDGRITRKHLLKLLEPGLINRTFMEVLRPETGGNAPVYFPARKGLELLACELNAPSLLSACCLRPNWQHLLHWVEVAQFHITLDRAVERQNHVEVERWLGEWDVANPDEREPENRYRLFALLSDPGQPRLVANPDAAFLLKFGNYAKVYYVEIDRATSGIQQMAHSKPKGFAAMAARQLHRHHYPETNLDTFSILLVTTSAQRRDLLRKAFADKPGAALWKFAAASDVTPATLLFEPIFYACAGESAPVVRLPKNNVGAGQIANWGERNQMGR